MNEQTFTEKLIVKERSLTILALILIASIAWMFLLSGAGTEMNIWAMSTWQFPPHIYPQPLSQQWTFDYFFAMLIMWWVMMIAMMLPSATPIVLLYARVYRQAQSKQQINSSTIPIPAFLTGYLIIWFFFSLVAVVLQWKLEQFQILHSMMMWITNKSFSAGLLIIAGIYQFTSIKHACLKQCRNPVEFITRHWKQGNSGALTMGIHHGIFCLGCCWLLMLLLFFGGIMNLVWIAGLAIIVLIEKLLPFGEKFSQLIGILLCLSGAWLIIN